MAEQIGRYKIIGELGVGGFATVYHAIDTLLEREVALKVLHPHLSRQESLIERFYKEARLVAGLNHRHIVTIFDISETEDGHLFIAMEFLNGGTLANRLTHQGVFSLDETTQLILPLADALDNAHAKNIVHRDIKAENVLFDEQSFPYLTDFGIARLMETVQTLTLAGTPSHMAPEQWRGNVLDGRTDVYQLGVMIFQMLTGQLPYNGPTHEAFLYQHLEAPIPFIHSLRPELPAACQDIINKAMAKDRQDRYQSVGKLAVDMQSLVRSDSLFTETEQVSQKLDESKEKRQGKLQNWKLIKPVISLMALVLLIAFLLNIQTIFDNGTDAGDTTPNSVAGDLATMTLTATSSRNPVVTNTQEVIGTTTPVNSITSQPSRIPDTTPVQTSTMDPNIPPSDGVLNDTWMRPADEMVMVYVPAGSFMMGSDDSESNADNDEFPQHEVTLGAFWLDRTEITNKQYDLCVEIGHCQPSSLTSNPLFNNQQQPAVDIMWEEAQEHCYWIGGRLPTEAEWEYAARGQNGFRYPWGNNFVGTYLNFCDTNCEFSWSSPSYDDGFELTAPVGSYPAGESWVGAWDMAGNVWEWVGDWYSEDYYSESQSITNPTGPTTGIFKVLRGGSWFNIPQSVRSAFRGYLDADFENGSIGFRCVIPT